MNIALWIVAGVLAAVFLVAGSTKLFIPYEKLAVTRGAEWVNSFHPLFVKCLGAVEILGSIGLILPAALGIAPVLVPTAAVGLGVIMIGAAIVSYRRYGAGHATVNVVYLVLAAFVAWGRFGPEAFG